MILYRFPHDVPMFFPWSLPWKPLHVPGGRWDYSLCHWEAVSGCRWPGLLGPPGEHVSVLFFGRNGGFFPSNLDDKPWKSLIFRWFLDVSDKLSSNLDDIWVSLKTDEAQRYVSVSIVNHWWWICGHKHIWHYMAWSENGEWTMVHKWASNPLLQDNPYRREMILQPHRAKKKKRTDSHNE